MATPYPRKYRGILKAASQRYHIPARVLAAQEFVESGFSRDVISGRRKSSAGAYGISQFIASTGREYGVRAGTSKSAVRTQVFGHAKYLHNLGASRNLRRAIASYAGGPGNPQYGYAAKVLGLAPAYRGVVRGVKAGAGGGGGSRVVGGSPASLTRSGQQSGGSALAELEAKALQRQQGPPSFTLPAAPAFAAHVTLPEGQVAGPPESGLVTPQQQAPSLTELLAAARADANTVNAKSMVTNAVAGTRIGGGGGAAGGGGRGKVIEAAGADRAGVSVKPVVKRYLSAVSALTHHPITITTGTNHNRLTVDGNVSDHWDGHAGDIAVPVDSHKGDLIATAALIQAGVPRGKARAMARRGGLYTINHAGLRIQVIWKTYAGGNHHNHVHVGVRPA